MRNGDNGQKRTTHTTNSSASAFGFCGTVGVVTSGMRDDEHLEDYLSQCLYGRRT